MFTFIAFLLTMLGCVNWLMVGLLQYDFIAGLFGFQASIFSRLCYILIGAGAMYLLLRVIINKGTFKIFERKKKKEKVSQPNSTQAPAPMHANVEAGKENISQQNLQAQQRENFGYPEPNADNQDNLFDEHFKEN